MSETGTQRWRVQYAGARLDRFLSEHCPELSRAQARRACEEGRVLVEGKAERPGYLLPVGAVVSVSGPVGPVEADPVKGEECAALGVSVVYEDDSLLIVEKPRGMSSVRLTAHEGPTVADCVCFLSPRTRDASPDRREAGLIHRLDYYTSGLMVAAQHVDAWRILREELFAGRISKEYRALVEGVPAAPYTVSAPLSESGSGRKMVIGEKRKSHQARPGRIESVTDIISVALLRAPVPPDEPARPEVAIATVRASRAKRHQVRAHLAHCGHPLVGDVQYGSGESIHELFPALAQLREGFLLHASRIELTHPMSGERVEFQSTSAPLLRLAEEYAA